MKHYLFSTECETVEMSLYKFTIYLIHQHLHKALFSDREPYNTCSCCGLFRALYAIIPVSHVPTLVIPIIIYL